jgi:hypothetical protein
MFKNQPDGLWILLTPTHADAIAIEACGSRQNFEQRRSKYMPDTCARTLGCSVEWLAGSVGYKRGNRQRWRLAGDLEVAPTAELELPVRHIRVLFAFPDHEYQKWSRSIVPAGHEYYCRYRSVRSITSKRFRTFLRQLAVRAQYYTKVDGNAV